ncbi:MAG: DUF3362 domain-containing protein, partial [Tepidimonas ignava]
LREALKAMGRADLIGNGKHHLVPTYQPLTDGSYRAPRRANSTPPAARSRASAGPAKPAQPPKGRVLTQHTGLPPRVTGAEPAPPTPQRRKPKSSGRPT